MATATSKKNRKNKKTDEKAQKEETPQMSPEAAAKMQKSQEKEKKSKKKVMTRISAACKVIRDLGVDGTITQDDGVDKADKVYMKARDASTNLKEALWSWRIVVSTMENLGMITTNGKEITFVSEEINVPK